MIVRTCIRIAAVMALRQSTWAGERVYDSNNAPLSEAVDRNSLPFIVVFTDEDDNDIEGRDMLSAQRRDLKLTIEFGIASPVPQTTGGPNVEIPATDDAYERALDMLEYQIVTQLFNRPLNPWGELVRELVPVVHKVTSYRAGEAERGVRWAARQRMMMVDTVGEPIPGVVLAEGHPVAKFLALAKVNTDLKISGVAELIEGLLATADAPSWRQAQATLGFTNEEVRGIGIAPPYDTPDSEVLTSQIEFAQSEEHSTVDNVGERVNTIEFEVDGKVVVIPAATENPV